LEDEDSERVQDRTGSLGSRTDRLPYDQSSATSDSKELTSEKKQVEKKIQRKHSDLGPKDGSPDLKLNLKKIEVKPLIKKKIT